MKKCLAILFVLALSSTVIADDASDARARAAMAMTAAWAPEEKAEPIDPYSAAVAQLHQWGTGTRALFFVDRPKQSGEYLAHFEVQPIGQMKSGAVWRVWLNESGQLVGEDVTNEYGPKTKSTDWVDDAWHRHSPMPGDHEHRCPMGHTWFHSGANSYGDRWAHTCPVCGMQDWQPKAVKAAAPVRRTATACPT